MDTTLDLSHQVKKEHHSKTNGTVFPWRRHGNGSWLTLSFSGHKWSKVTLKSCVFQVRAVFICLNLVWCRFPPTETIRHISGGIETCVSLPLGSSRVGQKSCPIVQGLEDLPVGQADFSGHLHDGRAWLKFVMGYYAVDSTLWPIKIATGGWNWSAGCSKV